MLGKHPDNYPRFRNVFLKDEEYPEYDNHIHVYTRVGGGNRESYEDEITELQSMPGYVTDHDDSFDSTFATFVFSVPDEWKPDFDKIISGDVKTVSAEYQARLRAVFPKLNDKWNQLFNTP